MQGKGNSMFQCRKLEQGFTLANTIVNCLGKLISNLPTVCKSRLQRFIIISLANCVLNTIVRSLNGCYTNIALILEEFSDQNDERNYARCFKDIQKKNKKKKNTMSLSSSKMYS